MSIMSYYNLFNVQKVYNNDFWFAYNECNLTVCYLNLFYSRDHYFFCLAYIIADHGAKLTFNKIDLGNQLSL